MLLVGLVFLSGGALLGAATLERADQLFANGFFPEAETAYLDALHKNPSNLKVNTLLGMIELFSNHLDDSEQYLRRAAQAGPFQSAAQNLLGEVYYRRDKFPESARWFRAAGSGDRAGPLEVFGEAAPYVIDGPPDETRLRFVATDPLPIVRVRVNGGEAATFLIDTGGAGVQLDADFAKRLNLSSAGETSVTLLDGSEAEMRYGRVASFRLGEFDVENVPVGIRRLPVLAGRKLDGVLGTVLLYHFLATIDYPQGELVLRRRSAEALRSFERRAQLEKQIEMPFWMASDHLIVARGRVNQAPPALLFVATGVTLGFTCPESMVDQASITIDRQGAILPATNRRTIFAPFVVNDLYLGEARQQNVNGLAGAFPAVLEHVYGFRIAGLIAHQFFRPYAVTLDFSGMRLFLGGTPQKPAEKSLIDVQTAMLPH